MTFYHNIYDCETKETTLVEFTPEQQAREDAAQLAATARSDASKRIAAHAAAKVAENGPDAAFWQDMLTLHGAVAPQATE